MGRKWGCERRRRRARRAKDANPVRCGRAPRVRSCCRHRTPVHVLPPLRARPASRQREHSLSSGTPFPTRLATTPHSAPTPGTNRPELTGRGNQNKSPAPTRTQRGSLVSQATGSSVRVSLLLDKKGGLRVLRPKGTGSSNHLDMTSNYYSDARTDPTPVNDPT